MSDSTHFPKTRCLKPEPRKRPKTPTLIHLVADLLAANAAGWGE